MVLLDRCPLLEPEIGILDGSSLWRRIVVQPGMCGPGPLLVGRIGDWTWETVSALCETNAFRAENAAGEPTYLAFYYLHLQASPALHPGSLGFGDRLEVVSRLFDFGSESILTLHRIRRTRDASAAPAPLDPGELYDHPAARSIYVESFNRWVCRSRRESNQDLVRSSPVGFRYRHLPVLPDRFSPRLACQRARSEGSFRRPRQGDVALGPGELVFEHPIDVTRDLNGVGLVYFAAYFSILDRAILCFWRHLGRSDASFLERTVLDQRICYLGNAEIDSVLDIRVRAWRVAGTPEREVYDLAVGDRDTGQPVALATVEMLAEAET